MRETTAISALDQAVLSALEEAIAARNELAAASLLRAHAEQQWLQANTDYLNAITRLHTAEYTARQASWNQP
jgi:hypothetical protein